MPRRGLPSPTSATTDPGGRSLTLPPTTAPTDRTPSTWTAPVGHPDDAATPATWAARLRRPLAVYAASRLLVLTVAVVTAAVSRSDLAAGPWPRLPGGGPEVLRALGRWDGAWYLDIARRGYPDVAELPDRLRTVAFFPELPGAVRILSFASGQSALVVGVVLSTDVGALAVCLIWVLVRELAGERAADRAAALVSFFPGAFVFSMVYTEGFLLAAAAASMLALCRGRWVLAGSLAAVGTAARPTGLALLAACAVAAAAAVPRERSWRPALAPVLASLGIGTYLLFLRLTTGAWDTWLRSQREAWGDEVDLGRGAILRVHDVATGGVDLSLAPLGLNDEVGAAGFLVATVGLALLWRWRPPAPVGVYATVAIAMAMASSHIGPRPRMILGAFPLVVAIAVAARGRVFAVVLGCSAAGLGVMTVLVLSSSAATP